MIPPLRDWTHQDILRVTQVVEVHWLPWNHLWKNKEEEKLSISLCWITNPSLGWFSRENRHATHAEDELLNPIITGGMEASKKEEKLLQIINISSHLQDTPLLQASHCCDPCHIPHCCLPLPSEQCTCIFSPYVWVSSFSRWGRCNSSVRRMMDKGIGGETFLVSLWMGDMDLFFSVSHMSG